MPGAYIEALSSAATLDEEGSVMVFPLFPLIGGALAGIGIEKGLTSLFGSTQGISKKDMKIGGEYHAPKEVFTPTTTYAQSYQYPDYNIAIHSPLAKVGSTKKAEIAPDISAGVSQSEGMNMTHIALIGAAGLVVYGVVKK